MKISPEARNFVQQVLAHTQYCHLLVLVLLRRNDLWVEQLLVPDPKERATCRSALEHPWIK